MPTDLGYSPAAAREDAKAEDRENEGAGKREKESNELEIEAQEEAGEQEEDEVRAAPPPTSSANAAHVTTVFGMKRSNPNVKRHDSYNYEEKYPEDGPYEEAAPTARVWRTHEDESRNHDSNMVEQFRDSVNLLLVSAGLFSAVVTAFVVQSSQNLRPDYAAMSASLLYELVLIQRAATVNGSSVNVITSPLNPSIAFVPATTDIWVNGLWFTSLFLSLTTALVAVLVKQWLHRYVVLPSGTPRDCSLIRQFRYAGFRKWHVQTIIGLLPVVIHLALTIFLVGLVVFLHPLHAILSWIICAGTIVVYGAYMVAAVLPILFPQCPYHTPLGDLIYATFHHAVPQVSWSLWRKDAFLDALRRRCFNDMLRHLPRVQTRSMKTLAKIESESVQQMSTKLAAEALDWLFSVSSNPTVQSIVIQAIGGLPMTSEHEFFELQSYADRKAMEDMQRALLRSCLQPDEENPEQHDRPIPGMELKVGRLLRFDVHFNDVFMWDRRIVMPDTEPSELATTINSTYWGYLADGPAGFSTLAALFKDCIRAESSLKLPLLRWSHLLRCVGRGDVFSPLSPETDDDTNTFPIDLCSAILDSFGRSVEHPIQDFSSPIVLEFKDAVPYIPEKIHDNALQMFSDFIPRSLSGQRYASLSKPLKLLIVVMEFLRHRLTLSESDNIICGLLITAVKQLDGETFSFQEATAVIIFLEDILPICFIRDACNAELTRNELCYNTILAYQHSITISPSACSVRGLRLMVDVMTADWEHKSDYQWYQSDIPCRVLAHLLANLIPNVYTVFLDKQCLQGFRKP
ncbi:hypothetical protein EV421DRAFT_732028 [Armillaria borealis]|uniref:DUF6535 domain-containing protein n=1 Tax=Armillaria borealis TaxID=47425 RepID=A0AA39JER5_9AGAR|nr:hypothetical protein EV421DRAFT_732028 [Armillaria borealis]